MNPEKSSVAGDGVISISNCWIRNENPDQRKKLSNLSFS